MDSLPDTMTIKFFYGRLDLGIHFDDFPHLKLGYSYEKGLIVKRYSGLELCACTENSQSWPVKLGLVRENNGKKEEFDARVQAAWAAYNSSR